MRPSTIAGAAAPLLGTLVCAGILAAQATPGDTVRIAAPPFQVLRFEENWSVFAPGDDLDGWERLKFIPLDPAGSSYLSFGGQLRLRAEAVEDFLFVDADDRDDAFGLLRAMMHADLHLGRAVRVFVEGRHSVAWDRDLPGGRRPADHDRLDLQNGFLEVGGGVAGGRVTARVGRQELLLGAQRLVSPLDWVNTRRTFDGARATLRRGPLAAEAFWARPVVVLNGSFNESDPATDFAGLTLSGTARAGSSWLLYALRLNQTDPITFSGATGTHDRTTVGGRVVAGSPARVLVEVEGGAQVGEVGSQRIRAGFVATDFSHQLAGVPSRPTATLGLDWASGDRGAGGSAGTFHQLYPLGHAFVGYMDVLGRQNLIEARGVLAASPTPTLQLRTSVHVFNRASTSDADYNVGGGVLQAADGRADRSIGQELDVTGALRVGRHARLEAGFGHFVPGDFLTGRAAGAAAMTWGYLGTSFTY